MLILHGTSVKWGTYSVGNARRKNRIACDIGIQICGTYFLHPLFPFYLRVLWSLGWLAVKCVAGVGLVILMLSTNSHVARRAQITKEILTPFRRLRLDQLRAHLRTLLRMLPFLEALWGLEHEKFITNQVRGSDRIGRYLGIFCCCCCWKIIKRSPFGLSILRTYYVAIWRSLVNWFETLNKIKLFTSHGYPTFHSSVDNFYNSRMAHAWSYFSCFFLF